MTDIALAWSNVTMSADISLAGVDLQTDEGMETAVIISLFTDKRAPDDAVIPDGSTNRRGWWGDVVAEVPGDEIGSLLWLLERVTLTAENMRLAQDYASDALAWFVTDGVAKSVTVTVTRMSLEAALMTIVILKPDGNTGTYTYVWTPQQ